jgi:hypothetical protein
MSTKKVIENHINWGIIATVKGDVRHTLDFANYYLNIGVSHILLYFDDPEDYSIGLLSKKKRVTCIPCTDSHWQELGLSSFDLDSKILCNLEHGKELLSSMNIMWAICVDSDELIYVFNENDAIKKILAQQKQDVGVIRVRSYESVITKDQYKNRAFSARWFKIQKNDNVWISFFHKILNYNIASVTRKHYFFGHTEGKSFFRTNLNFHVVNHHKPKFTSKTIHYIELDELGLLHFDCMLYEKWKQRWMWRVSGETISICMGPQRLKQFEFISKIIKNGDEKKLKKLYNKWFFFNKSRIYMLHIIGKIKKIDIDDSMFCGCTNETHISTVGF